MRARYPDSEGFIGRDWGRLGYEVYGEGDTTLLLLPTWTIVHSRFWKMQVPYLARHFRVVTFDGPGNGRSDRPVEPGPYAMTSIVADAVEVLEATSTRRSVLVSLSQAASWSLRLSVDHPDRVQGQIFIGPSLPITPQEPDRAGIAQTFGRRIEDPQGWEKYNAHYWLTNYEDFVRFFFSECLSEPHSTKPREDTVGWALETTPEVLVAESQAKFGIVDREKVLELCGQVRSPTMVIHGTDDGVSPFSRGQALAEAIGGTLVAIDGGGHLTMARDPVSVNRAIKDFVDRVAGKVTA